MAQMENQRSNTSRRLTGMFLLIVTIKSRSQSDCRGRKIELEMHLSVLPLQLSPASGAVLIFYLCLSRIVSEMSALSALNANSWNVYVAGDRCRWWSGPRSSQQLLQVPRRSTVSTRYCSCCCCC